MLRIEGPQTVGPHHKRPIIMVNWMITWAPWPRMTLGNQTSCWWPPNHILLLNHPIPKQWLGLLGKIPQKTMDFPSIFSISSWHLGNSHGFFPIFPIFSHFSHGSFPSPNPHPGPTRCTPRMAPSWASGCRRRRRSRWPRRSWGPESTAMGYNLWPY